MIPKYVFVSTMDNLKSLNDKFNNINESMRELDPNFCGFYVPSIFDITLRLIKFIMNDNANWIEYFVYDKDWLNDFTFGDITIDEEPINITNWGDVYDFLKKE